MNAKRILLIGITSLLGMTITLGGCSMGVKESMVAEKYPTKPITIIVPFAAGGNSDMLARALEKSALKHLGQPLVVVNMPGGGATIGMNELAGSEAHAALLGGHVQLIGVYSPAVLKEHIESGTIKILGVADENRLTLPGFENVPTFKEQGIDVALTYCVSEKINRTFTSHINRV